MDKKCCIKCGDWKPGECFSKCSAKPDGLYPMCKECYSQYFKEYKKRPDYQRNSDPWRDYNFRTKYGITLQTYNTLLAAQASGCAICGRKMTEDSKRLCVDHCHETGAVRELLCNACNVALGQVKDDVETLSKMITYLLKHSKTVPEQWE